MRRARRTRSYQSQAQLPIQRAANDPTTGPVKREIDRGRQRPNMGGPPYVPRPYRTRDDMLTARDQAEASDMAQKAARVG